MFEITLLINLFISLIKLKNIHEKYQIKEYTCKFEIDKIIYSKCSLEQHMTLAKAVIRNGKIVRKHGPYC